MSKSTIRSWLYKPARPFFHHQGVVWIHWKIQCDCIPTARKFIISSHSLLHQSSLPDMIVSTASLLFFYSHPVVSLQRAAAATLPLSGKQNANPTRLADIISSDDKTGGFSAACWTYLSLQFQICFVSYEDHGEFVSVFDSENLSLEFVDFFKAVNHITCCHVVSSEQTDYELLSNVWMHTLNYSNIKCVYLKQSTAH